MYVRIWWLVIFSLYASLARRAMANCQPAFYIMGFRNGLPAEERIAKLSLCCVACVAAWLGSHGWLLGRWLLAVP